MSGGGKNLVFYHICCNENTYNIVQEQILHMIFSDLYENVDKIYCFLVGNEMRYIDQVISLLQESGQKFDIQKIGVNDNTHERFTLLSIPEYVKPGDKILYIHSKGISKDKNDIVNIKVKQWRVYMEYFLFHKCKKCIELLKEYDTVGVNYFGSYETYPPYHYSGNFWWATADYFLTLDEKNAGLHNSAEFYLASNRPNACNMFRSVRDHYNQFFPTKHFVDTDGDIAAD